VQQSAYGVAHSVKSFGRREEVGSLWFEVGSNHKTRLRIAALKVGGLKLKAKGERQKRESLGGK